MLGAISRKFSALTPVGQRNAKAAHHARCQAAGPRFVGPGRYYAPPPGYRNIESSAEAIGLLAATARPGRSDAAANHDAIAWAVGKLRSKLGTVCAGHARIAGLAMQRAGRRISASAVGRRMRAWEAAGVLDVVQRGSSKFLNELGRDIAPIYAIVAAEPQVSPQSDDHPVGVVDLGTVRDDLGHYNGGNIPSTPIRRMHPERFRPRNQRERIDALASLAQMLGIDYDAYRGDLHNACIAFFKAGWTAQAIAYAATHERDGGCDWSRISEGTWTIRVLNSRLKRWRDADRRPVAAPVRPETPRRGPQLKRPKPPATTGPVVVATKAAGEAARAALAATRALLTQRYGRSRPELMTHRTHLVARGLA